MFESLCTCLAHLGGRASVIKEPWDLEEHFASTQNPLIVRTNQEIDGTFCSFDVIMVCQDM